MLFHVAGAYYGHHVRCAALSLKPAYEPVRNWNMYSVFSESIALYARSVQLRGCKRKTHTQGKLYSKRAYSKRTCAGCPAVPIVFRDAAAAVPQHQASVVR